jgi:hypothetical protein
MLGYGVFSPFLGGFFGLVSLMLCVPMLLVNISLAYKKTDLLVYGFFFFIFFSIVVSFGYYVLRIPEQFTYELLYWSISGLYFNVLLFYLGRYIDIEFIAKLGIPTLILFMFIVAFNLSNGMFNAKPDAGDAYEQVSSYQGFARSIIVVSFVTIVYFYNRFSVVGPIYVLTFVLLFLNGARTEFLLFNISLVLCGLLYSISSVKHFIGFSFLIFIVIASAPLLIEYAPDNRVLTLLNLISEIGSGSEAVRFQVISFSVDKIADSPILGDYGSYTVYGGPAFFPHNFLTVWINYGLFGLIMYLGIMSYMWVFALLNYRRYVGTFFFSLFLLFLVLLVFFSLSIVVSKHHLYMIFGFVVGLYAQLKSGSMQTPASIN